MLIIEEKKPAYVYYVNSQKLVILSDKRVDVSI